MREPYIPLFTSTIRSSLWSLSGDCLKVFLTMALESDPEGYVSASADGIRRLVDLPLAEVQKHLSVLEAPDPHSKDITRDPVRDGRRLERVANGWRVVNIGWYREQARKQAELFRKRKWWDEKGSDARRAARPTEREVETDLNPPMPPFRKRTRSKRAVKQPTPMPEDWKPTDKHVAFAKRHGLNLEFEVEGYRGWAEGKTTASWDGTFRTRLAKSAEWKQERGQSRQSKTDQPEDIA